MIVDALLSLAHPLADLTLLPGNPRRGDVAAIAASLSTFGQRKPIVANRNGKVVIAGNHTVLAAKELGWSEVAVTWVDDDDTTAKAFALADNRTAELGTYDEALLAQLIGSVSDADASMLAATGWTPDDYLSLLERIGATTRSLERDADDVPDEAPAVTKPGDIWLLGVHRLACGDATEPDTLATVLAGEAAELLVTDPPYGVAYASKNEFLNAVDKGNHIQTPIENDHLDLESQRALWDGAWRATRPTMAPGASYYVSGPQMIDELMRNLLASLDENGFPLRHMLVWAKDAFVLGRSDYNYQHEPILYGWVDGAHRFYGPSNETSVWQIPRSRLSDLHSTMKPVALWRRAIENSTRPSDTVVDIFAGSGTAVIASEMTSRRARVVEIDPNYCDVICKRYQQATGTLPVRESTGEAVSFVDE